LQIKNIIFMKVNYETNDLVKLTNDAYNIYAKQVFWNENAFHILSLNNESVTLSDIKAEIPLNAIEPIPIDSVADACIYYDPALAADIILNGMPIPTHNTDLSYYIDGFDRMHIEDTTLKVLFLEKGFQYVHQVQHWLREEHDCDGLKIRQTVKSL